MREFLKNLELNDDGVRLTKELIDKIMAEHGKSITAEKEKYAELENKIKDHKTEVDNFKAEIDKLNETIEADKKSLESLQNVTNENEDLKAQIQMNDSNVKKEFNKFVISEVKSKVDEKTDFATALKNYKEENPQYFGETVVKKVQTSPALNGGVPKAQTTNDIMNDILRGAKNEN